MKETAIIKVEKRVEANSRASKRLRETGYLPGSVYGKGVEAFSIKIKEEEFRKQLSTYGRNYVFNLDLGGEQIQGVMVKDIQHFPLKNRILNVDFQKVSLVDKTKVDLNIKIIGNEVLESKRLLIIRQMDTIPVKGLPQDIPDNIEIDVSELKEGEKICIGDINFPKGIATEIEESQIVLSVNTSILTVKDTDEENEMDGTTEETKEV